MTPPRTASPANRHDGEGQESARRAKAAGAVASEGSSGSSNQFSVDVDAVEASMRAARNFAGVIAESLAQTDEVTLPQLRVLVLA